MSENTLAIVSEIWSMVRESVPVNDLPDLAEGLVNVLLDYDIDLEDIRHEFSSDPEIIDAVEFVDEFSDDTESEYEEYAEEDDDGDW